MDFDVAPGRGYKEELFPGFGEGEVYRASHEHNARETFFSRAEI